jgi:hypothetical protein
MRFLVPLYPFVPSTFLRLRIRKVKPVAFGEPAYAGTYTIQAWAESPVPYSRDGEDGHYVVAIGYDRDSVYFVDPQLFEIARIIRTGSFLIADKGKTRGCNSTILG